MDADYTQLAINILGGLICLLIILYLFKRFRLARYEKDKKIKIVNVVPIGSKEKIILVDVNNTQILVGATPNHIETLFVFNEPDFEKTFNTGIEPNVNFSEQLDNIENK